MVSAKQGNQWYHFITSSVWRGLLSRMNRDLPHSSKHSTTRLSNECTLPPTGIYETETLENETRSRQLKKYAGRFNMSIKQRNTERSKWRHNIQISSDNVATHGGLNVISAWLTAIVEGFKMSAVSTYRGGLQYGVFHFVAIMCSLYYSYTIDSFLDLINIHS